MSGYYSKFFIRYGNALCTQANSGYEKKFDVIPGTVQLLEIYVFIARLTVRADCRWKMISTNS